MSKHNTDQEQPTNCSGVLDHQRTVPETMNGDLMRTTEKRDKDDEMYESVSAPNNSNISARCFDRENNDCTKRQTSPIDDCHCRVPELDLELLSALENIGESVKQKIPFSIPTEAFKVVSECKKGIDLKEEDSWHTCSLQTDNEINNEGSRRNVRANDKQVTFHSHNVNDDVHDLMSHGRVEKKDDTPEWVKAKPKPRVSSSIQRIQEHFQKDQQEQSRPNQRNMKANSTPFSSKNFNMMRRQRSRSRSSKYGRSGVMLIQRPYRRWLGVSTCLSDARYIVSSKKKAVSTYSSRDNNSTGEKSEQIDVKAKCFNQISEKSIEDDVMITSRLNNKLDRHVMEDTGPMSTVNSTAETGSSRNALSCNHSCSENKLDDKLDGRIKENTGPMPAVNDTTETGSSRNPLSGNYSCSDCKLNDELDSHVMEDTGPMSTVNSTAETGSSRNPLSLSDIHSCSDNKLDDELESHVMEDTDSMSTVNSTAETGSSRNPLSLSGNHSCSDNKLDDELDSHVMEDIGPMSTVDSIAETESPRKTTGGIHSYSDGGIKLDNKLNNHIMEDTEPIATVNSIAETKSPRNPISDNHSSSDSQLNDYVLVDIDTFPINGLAEIKSLKDSTSEIHSLAKHPGPLSSSPPSVAISLSDNSNDPDIDEIHIHVDYNFQRGEEKSPSVVETGASFAFKKLHIEEEVEKSQIHMLSAPSTMPTVYSNFTILDENESFYEGLGVMDEVDAEECTRENNDYPMKCQPSDESLITSSQRTPKSVKTERCRNRMAKGNHQLPETKNRRKKNRSDVSPRSRSKTRAQAYDPDKDSFRQDGGLAGRVISSSQYEFTECPEALVAQQKRGRKKTRNYVPFDGTNGVNPLREEMKQYADLGLHPIRPKTNASSTIQKFMRRTQRKDEAKTEYYNVQAMKNFDGKLPGQLTFKKGQIIKQLDTGPLPKNGMSFGYYRAGRLRRKRVGLYPCSHVTCQLEVDCE